MGRIAGLPTTPNRGSILSKIAHLEVGDVYHYAATDSKKVMIIEQKICSATRYPTSFEGRQFSCRAMTCVYANKMGETKLLVEVTRIK